MEQVVRKTVHYDLNSGFMKMYRKFGKRLFDITGATIGLLFLAPIMAILAVMVRLKLGSPVLFCQERPGLHGKPFTLYKFRTMTNATDKYGRLLSDAKRLTPFGKFLRTTSLDELPELWNVLKGDMSLVGPRPLLMEYLDLYTSEQARRHEVKPGITGWAQINGRNALTWEEKFKRDVWYVNHVSFLLDLKIIILTLHKIINRDGVSEPGHATMSKFTGTKNNG